MQRGKNTDGQPVRAMHHKFSRPALIRHKHRLATRPRLQDGDAEGLVPGLASEHGLRVSNVTPRHSLSAESRQSGTELSATPNGWPTVSLRQPPVWIGMHQPVH